MRGERPPSVSKVVGFTPARSLAEFRDLLADSGKPVIRSRADFEKLLADKEKNPLGGLDEAAVKAFTASVVFTDRGLCGFDYGPIQDLLSFYRFRVLIGHFGMDLNLFDDLGDYKCTKPNCVTSLTDICIGDNCK